MLLYNVIPNLSYFFSMKENLIPPASLNQKRRNIKI